MTREKSEEYLRCAAVDWLDATLAAACVVPVGNLDYPGVYIAIGTPDEIRDLLKVKEV